MRALAALAILVTGAVAAFSVYAFGWQNEGTETRQQPRDPRSRSRRI